MEDDIDIYEDLPNFGTKYSENFISNNEENAVEEHLKLKKQITELTIKLENFEKVNENLEINLFSLLKTAKAEIARKDKMIDELRKKLEDTTLKRGMYSKTNDCLIQKSIFRETIVNTHHKSSDICLSPNENNIETLAAYQGLCNQIKDKQNRNSPNPVTVFGERLLKRLTDEQNLENKDKQSNKFSNCNNGNKRSEGYIIESDKENGSQGDTNFYNAKELQPSTNVQYKEDEHDKNPFHLNSKNETSSRLEQKSVFTTSYARKRASEEINEHIDTKKAKSSGEGYFSESTRKETSGDRTFESKEKVPPSRCVNIESSTHLNEKQRYTGKNLNTGYIRNSRVALRKHVCFADDINKEEGRKVARSKLDISCDKRDVSNRSLKSRHNKSDQNSTFTLNERDNNYRSNHSEHHRRAKQREHHRVDDHRSHVKSTSYVKSNREEKYNSNKNQYNKHTNYDEKLESRNNFRSTNADKLKISKKDSYNVHSMIKHSISDRISTDQKISDAKKTNHYNKYEVREVRLKNSERSIKRDNKYNEYNDYSNHKLNNENITEHPKYSIVSKQGDGEKDNEIVGQINRISETETKFGIHDELQKYVEEKLENSSIDLKDDKISNISNKSSPTIYARDTCEEKLKECQNICVKSDRSLTIVNNTLSKSPLYNTIKTETVEQSKISSDILQTVPISNSNIKSFRDEKNLENTDDSHTENIENIENIEKFIYHYASSCNETSIISNAIHTLDTSLPNLVENEESITTLNDLSYNCEKNSKVHCIQTLNTNSIVLFNENCHRDKKFSTSDEKLKNIPALNHIQRNLVKDDRYAEIEQTIPLKCVQNILQEDDKRIESETLTELTENNYLFNNPSKQLSNDQSNIMIDCIPRNDCTSSTTLPSLESLDKEMDEKTNNHINVNIASEVIKTDDDVRNNYNNNSNDRDEKKLNQNDSDSIVTTRIKYEDTHSVASEIMDEKVCRIDNKYMINTEGAGLEEFKKKQLQKRNDDRNTRITSTNVHGKIIVATRRKKPVCLANSNANMTVLINNKFDSNVDIPSADNTKTKYNPIVKITRTSDHDAMNTS